MIAIPQSLARQYRAVLRRCGTRQDWQRDPPVTVRAGREGLVLECVLGATALRLHVPGKREENSITFPASLLAQFEGRGDDPVTLSEVGPEQGRAAWVVTGVTESREFRPIGPDRCPDFPKPPSSMVSIGGDALRALGEAARTAATQETGRSLNRVLLTGEGGRVIATDGRQLLIHDGFRFPFQEEVLIPALGVWGCKELPREEELLMGMGKEHLTVRLGSWEVDLRTEPRGRFPPAEGIVPSARAARTRFRLRPEDVERLRRELPRIPCGEDGTPMVEVEVGDTVVVRPRGVSKDPPSEWSLPGAAFRGNPVRVTMNPAHLLRALELGFTEVEIVRPDKPLCCRDVHRVFVWMPLSDSAPAAPVPVNPTNEERDAMPDDSMRIAAQGESEQPTAFDPLAEAEEVRALLHQAQSRLTRLVNALRQFRRRSRALRSAVASLRDMSPLVP